MILMETSALVYTGDRVSWTALLTHRTRADGFTSQEAACAWCMARGETHIEVQDNAHLHPTIRIPRKR